MKRTPLGVLTRSASALFPGRLSRRGAGQTLSRLISPPRLRHAVEVEQATRHALLYFVVPLWLAAGLLDWYRHRRTHIERTAGTYESAIHALMMAEACLPAMMGLFLEVNAGVLLAAVAAFILHEATAYWDVSYAETRRRVTPSEQHIHSFLEVVPLMAVTFLIVLHWDQARALVRVGDEPARLTLRRKRPPLARGYVRGLLVAIGLFAALPYAEELWRCYRYDRSIAPRPEPPLPATPTLIAPDR
jgi:hypothetical protein